MVLINFRESLISMRRMTSLHRLLIHCLPVYNTLLQRLMHTGFIMSDMDKDERLDLTDMVMVTTEVLLKANFSCVIYTACLGKVQSQCGEAAISKDSA